MPKILGFVDAAQRSILEGNNPNGPYSNAEIQSERETRESLERRNADLEKKLQMKEQEVDQVLMKPFSNFRFFVR
jgi:hypothetical protein